MEELYILNEDCAISVVNLLPSNKRMTFSLTSKILSKTFFMRDNVCPNSKLDLKKLIKFKHVYNLTLLAYNKFKNVELFYNLTHLSIGKKNNLECISGLKNLYSLNIHSNKLTNINTLSNITSVELQYESIQMISSLISLKKLCVLRKSYRSRNEPSIQYNLNYHTNLQTLILPYQIPDYNIFSDIRLLKNLEYISCDNVDVFASGYSLQKLTYLKLNLHKLRKYDTSSYGNLLSMKNRHDKLLYNAPCVQNLKLKYFVSDKIDCLQKLTHLSLKFINLTFSLTILQNLKSLKLTQLERNHECNIENTTLEKLYIWRSYNGQPCSFVGNFELLTHLTIENVVNKIDFSCMLNLKELKIKSKGKKFINIDLLTQLTYLYLGQNTIKIKHMNRLTNLLILDIGSHKIESFDCFVKLTELHISANNIDLYNASNLRNLRKIYFSRKNPKMVNIGCHDLKIYM